LLVVGGRPNPNRPPTTHNKPPTKPNKKTSSCDKKRLPADSLGASSYLPRFSARLAVGHGQELAPDPRYKLRGGCCDVTGPNPQPLWIRNEYSVVRSILRMPPNVSTIQQPTRGSRGVARLCGHHAFRLWCSPSGLQVQAGRPAPQWRLNFVSFVSSDAERPPANPRPRRMLSIHPSAKVARLPPGCRAPRLARLASRVLTPIHRATNRLLPKTVAPSRAIWRLLNI
jgi:hypothetical protein